MGLKSKLFGLGAALTLGLAMIAPASASVGSPAISVTITPNVVVPAVGLAGSGTTIDFGNVTLNAVGPTGGYVITPEQQFTLSISSDTGNFNSPLLTPSGFDIQVRLTGGPGTNPSLAPAPGAITPFENSSVTNFEIPGRYLSISSVGNPIQAKFTGGNSCANVWNGTSGCAPRDSDNISNHPIYRVADAAGLMGLPEYNGGTCRSVGAGGNDYLPWGGTCGNNTFSDTGAKLITHVRPGSGAITTNQLIGLTLKIPAGVYPTTYSGILVIEQVAPIAEVSTP